MADTLPNWFRQSLTAWILVTAVGSRVSAKEETHPWKRSKEFAETSFTETIASKVRIHVNAPLDDKGDAARATRLIVYTLPAGNTIEQTLGCQAKLGLDWHYDIQHVAAQIRLLRSLSPDEKIVLLCVEGPGLGWSPFRKANPDADKKMADLVDKWRQEFGSDDTHVMVTGHSNGGSFMFGMIDGADEIPAYIDRIAFLDSNYNFDAGKHSAKIARWLKGSDERRLIVVAYDDREITLNGKKVLKPGQGTYNATKRMREAFGKMFQLTETKNPPFEETSGLDGRIHFYVHPNPQNKILHTILVGEMNGLAHVATLGTPNEEKWGKFGGPRAYTKWVQAEPTPGGPPPPASIKPPTGTTAKAGTASAQHTAAPSYDGPTKKIDRHLETNLQTELPPRPMCAMGGSEFVKSLERLSPADREAQIAREILSGNFPEFQRRFKTVPISGAMKTGGKTVSTSVDVMPDYLAIGSDSDFVRIPMTPQTAQQIADKFGCILPTRKLVDAIDKQAEVQVAPHPMTQDRETIATFLKHNRIVEKQRTGNPLGLLVIGDKKDIVLTPRIFEKPHRLAIYGWRQLNGQPIQPLTIVHVDHYVDYSHGVRLVRDSVELDGRSVKISDLLADSDRCGLVSDEGPMVPPRYPK